MWPDLVRNGTGVVPAKSSAKASYNRPQWHFVNFPLGLVAGGDAGRQKALEERARQEWI